MKIKFKAFTSILVGMTLIGLAIGFLVGYYIGYIPESVPENEKAYWIYIAAPILGVGSGLVMYGALFEERD